MAENTNYIGVAMGMDVTDLKAGLSEANKQIQLANSEFKAASSGMDDWTKSTEGITAKVKQLDSVLKMQKSKLAGLTAEYEKVAKEQGEGSEAARKLKVQINNQQAVVNKTQKEFDNFSNVLAKAEAGIVDLQDVTVQANGKIKDFGNSAKEAGEKTEGGFGGNVAKGIVGGIAAIGAAAVAAVGSFLSLGESTRELRENLAKLDTAFDEAGHSADAAQKTYTDLYGILGDEGSATEAAQQLAILSKDEKDLAANTKILTGVMAKYGESIPTTGLAEGMAATAAMGEVQGTLADALEWQGVNLEDYNAQLATMATEEERAAYIQQTLIGLYGEAADAYSEKNKSVIEAREAEAELAKVTAELGAIAEPIMTTLKLLAVDLLKSITPFVEMLGTGLRGALEGNTGAAAAFADGLNGIIGVLLEKVTTLLPTILTMILELVPRIIETLLGALPSLITTLSGLIVQIIEALGPLLPQIVQKIIEVVPLIITALVNAIPQLLVAAIQFLQAIVEAIPSLIESLLAALPNVITTIITALVEAIPLLLDAAIQLLNAIVDAIPVILALVIKNLPMILDAIINGVLDALPQLLDAAITLLFALIDAIPVIVSELNGALPDIIATIVKALVKAIPKLFSTAKDLLGKIIDAVGDLIKKLPSHMGKIITGMVEGLKKGISKIKGVGKDIIEGLWNGIKDMGDWIAKKIKGFGEDVLGGIKDFFGINSPSKLMEEEVGMFLGQGIGTGLLDSIPFVKKQLTKFSDYVADNLGGIKSGLSLGVSGAGAYAGAGAGGRVVNIDARQTLQYNGNMSLKEVKQREREHYVSIKTKLKAEGLV